MKKTSRLSAWLPALLALSLAAGSALAQERARFKLAEQLPAAETVRYAVIDSHAPPQPVDTVDLQVLAEERLLHHPHAFVRAGLNEKLAREGEEQDRALVEKYFGGKTLELKEFEVRLSREYPSDTRYMNAGAMQGGLIGVLVGAIMDGMRNRGNVQQILTVRMLLHVDGQPFECNERSSYTEETTQEVLMQRADAGLSTLAWALRKKAREMEEAGKPPAAPDAGAQAAPGEGQLAPAAPAPDAAAAPAK